MRRVISLKEGWNFYQDGQCSQVALPHTWNAVDGQDGGNDYYRGTCRYVRELERPAMEPGSQVWLEVKGAAMTAQVSLNGELLANHQWTTATVTASIPRRRTLPFTAACTGR